MQRMRDRMHVLRKYKQQAATLNCKIPTHLRQELLCLRSSPAGGLRGRNATGSSKGRDWNSGSGMGEPVVYRKAACIAIV